MTISWAAYAVVDEGCDAPNVEWIIYDKNTPIGSSHPFVKHLQHLVQLEEVGEYTFAPLYYKHNKKLYDYLKIGFPRVSNDIEDQHIFEKLTQKVSAKPWDGKL